MYNVVLILDEFFLKYEGKGRGGSQIDPPVEKLPSKSPVFLGLITRKNVYITIAKVIPTNIKISSLTHIPRSSYIDRSRLTQKYKN